MDSDVPQAALVLCAPEKAGKPRQMVHITPGAANF
jgi:hypothetical protein